MAFIKFSARETASAMREEVVAITQSLTSKVLGTVVLSTPVGLPTSWQSPPPKGYQPGAARASWRVTLKVTPSTDTQFVDPGGAATISKGIRKIRRIKFGDEVTISSLKPYMGRLDQGWSRQAPANFIEKAARRGVKSTPSGAKLLPASKKVR
jgi:hypothetical protein